MERSVCIENVAIRESVQIFCEGVEFHLHEGGVHTMAQRADGGNIGIAQGDAKIRGVDGEFGGEGFEDGVVFFRLAAEDGGE